MQKYIAPLFCILLGQTLCAREFTIVNKTGDTIYGSGSIAQTIHLKPLGQEQPIITHGQASWRSGPVSSQKFISNQLMLPGSVITLQDEDSLKIALPDEAVREKDMYGYTDYDFTQSPVYDIKTSKVIGSKIIYRGSGPIIAGKKPTVRQVTVPVYARTRLVPQNGESYTLSIEGNSVVVSESTLS